MTKPSKVKHRRRTTNPLEKSGITVSSSYTILPWKITNKSPSTTQQASTNKNGEIKDLKNQIKLLKQNQRQHDAQEKPKHTDNREEHPEPKTSRSPLSQEAILTPTLIC